ACLLPDPTSTLRTVLLYACSSHPDLRSSPTRRSSDLLKGSAALTPNFHLFGNFANQDLENSSVDFDQWRVGVGYNQQISRSWLRSEEHTSELQSRENLVCRLLLEKKNMRTIDDTRRRE